MESQLNTEINRQELRMTFCQTWCWCIINFGDIPKECLQLVSNRDHIILYRSWFTPPDQHANVDMRSANAQNTKPREVVHVSANDAAGNCMPEQTSASQFNAVAEGEISRPLKILSWLKEAPRRVTSDEHTLALLAHNSVVAGATSCTVVQKTNLSPHEAEHTEKLRIAQMSGVKVDADTARRHRNQGNTDAEELKIMDSLVQRSQCKTCQMKARLFSFAANFFQELKIQRSETINDRIWQHVKSAVDTWT